MFFELLFAEVRLEVNLFVFVPRDFSDEQGLARFEVFLADIRQIG